MPERVLVLYRPALPSLRAQSIGVLLASHALARRGHHVTLFADRGAPEASPEAALELLGLPPLSTLDLSVAPSSHPGLAGLWFRARLAGWAAGPAGHVIARDRRRLVSSLSWLGRHRVVVEAHGLDSALAAERGEDPTPHLEVERAAAVAAHAFMANCEGVMNAWRQLHGALLPDRQAVIHNGVGPERRREASAQPEPVIRVLGSLRTYKGADWLLSAAATLPLPLEWVGGTDAERAAAPVAPNTRLLPPVPYPQVPDLLAQASALLLPLDDNLFGREQTSPLKLWDYLATAAPILAPDLPSVRRVADRAGRALHLFRPGDTADLRRAALEALAAPPRDPFVRSWDQRAAEVEALLA